MFSYIKCGRQYRWSESPSKKHTVAICFCGRVCFMSPRDAKDIVAEERARAKLVGRIVMIWKMSEAEIRQHWIAEAKTQKLCEMARFAGEAWAKLRDNPRLLLKLLNAVKGGR